jgi:hypothetical protein
MFVKIRNGSVIEKGLLAGGPPLNRKIRVRRALGKVRLSWQRKARLLPFTAATSIPLFSCK